MECKGDIGLGNSVDNSVLNPLGVESFESPNVAGILVGIVFVAAVAYGLLSREVFLLFPTLQ